MFGKAGRIQKMLSPFGPRKEFGLCSESSRKPAKHSRHDRINVWDSCSGCCLGVGWKCKYWKQGDQ